MTALGRLLPVTTGSFWRIQPILSGRMRLWRHGRAQFPRVRLSNFFERQSEAWHQSL